jgi:hypothetical protein
VAGARSRAILFGLTPVTAPPRAGELDFRVIESEVAESRRARLWLRHWSGSTLAAASVSAFDIADQMGNSPQEGMETYVHTRSEEARDRVRRAVAEAARKAS